MIDYKIILDAAWAAHLALREPNAPIVISLFAGCGGSSLGYSMAGYKELLAVESNKRTCETFRLNFPNIPIFEGDIAGLSDKEALRLAGLQPGKLNILDGSPPCQGFSIAGRRQFGDPRNRLFEEYVRLLRAFLPEVFVLENVSGLVKGKMVLAFAEMTRQLKISGYKVKCRLLNAKWYGVPQSRKRLIWIGVRDDLGTEPSHPPAQTVPMALHDALPHINACKSQRINPWINSKQPAATITSLSRGYEIVSGQPAPTLQAKGIGEVWKEQFVVSGDRGFLTEADLIEAAIKPTWQAYRVLLGKERPKHFGLQVVDPDRPSPTIIKDAGGFATGLVYSGEIRKLTIPEIKRLQSFPDEFQVVGNFQQKWAQIGNSVPPLMMRAIARYIRQEILNRHSFQDLA